MVWRFRHLTGVALSAILLVGGVSGTWLRAAAVPDATRPAASAPTTRPSGRDLQALINSLGEEDPGRRASAAETLLQLGPESLLDLRQAAMACRPLSPAQILALSDVVAHLALIDEAYTPERPESAVLGITMGADVAADTPEGTAMGLAEGTVGVTITDRMQGFDAYARLRNGDVIVAVTGVAHFTSTQDFQGGVRALRPGQRADLTLFRAGKRMTLSVLLYPRPEGYQDLEQDWRGSRLAFAAQLWHYEFELPLADPAAR
jgi:PDZ domain